MKKTWIVAASLAVVFATLLASSGRKTVRGDDGPGASSGRVPRTAPGTVRADSLRDFTLKDLDGKTHALSEWRQSKIVVLAWTAAACPVAMVYGPRLAALSKTYADRGVAFVGVVSGANLDLAEVKAHAEKAGIAYPVLVDADAALSQRLGVETTTAVVVLDANRRARYRGALDDQYDVGGRKAAPSKRWLVDALDALLAGKVPPVQTTAAPGCPIDVPAAGKAPATVTWNHDVAAIVHRRCASCHRPDEAAPFPLLSYADAKKRSATMKAAVDAGRMPPWHAEGPRGRYANDRRLAPEEKDALLAWLDGGTPEGQGAPPAPPAALTKDGWEIGKPDAVFTFTKPEAVPAEGVVPYRFVEVPTNFAEDRWYSAVEVKPGAPQVVHHVLVAAAQAPVEGGGRRGRLAGRGGRGAEFVPTNGFLAAMVPGGRAQTFPEGTAKRLPKGATLVFQMHYTPNGVAAEDATSIGFKFLKEPPAQEVHTVGAFNPVFSIPAGAPDFEVKAVLPVPWDVHVLAFMPHMHLRGKAFRYAYSKDMRTEELLLAVPAYDFNWQTPYRLAEPIAIPKNSMFRAVGVFDNSDKNPYNPDPTAVVHWGDQTWDEMMIGYVDFVRDGETAESRAAEKAGR